jgi:hypothetical protein
MSMSSTLETSFNDEPTPPWRITEASTGIVTQRPGELLLLLRSAGNDAYGNAQISDYMGRHFSWRPPLRMTVTAWASAPASELRGTAGFGFWNHPFVPGERGVHLPQAVWFFFASPPSKMRLAKDVPGTGWKAATFDATRWPFFALLPTAPIGLLLMRIPALYNRLWPIGQRAIGVSETLLDGNLLAASHTYTIDWRDDGATFAIDGLVVHEANNVPRGPLGFIAWMDNQYAIVTPQGQFGFGRVRVEQEQSLTLEHVRIEPL